jgi:RNA polymerase primary sigma factor
MMGEVFKEWYEESPDFLDSGCFENEVTEEINDNNYISSDVVTEYLNSIKYFEVLTPAEEREYALQIRSGDQDARKKLIEHNAKLVIHAAKKRSNRSPLEFADLIQAGNIGLVQAVDKFDPDKGRFSTFAMHWIIASMKRTEENFARPIRLPSYMVQVKTKINRAKEQLTQELGREPTVDELVEATGCSKRNIQSVLKRDYSMYSLNNLVGEEKEDECLSLFATDEDVEEITINEIMSTLVAREVKEIITKKLLKREQKVIIMKYFENCTVDEISQTLNLSKKIVKEIEKDGLAKIKKYCLLKDFKRHIKNQETLYCKI